jgi:hypothetical protein
MRPTGSSAGGPLKTTCSVHIGGERVARYFVKDLHGELAVGANLGTRAHPLPTQRGWFTTDRDTGSLVPPEITRATMPARSRLTYTATRSVCPPVAR